VKEFKRGRGGCIYTGVNGRWKAARKNKGIEAREGGGGVNLFGAHFVVTRVHFIEMKFSLHKQSFQIF